MAATIKEELGVEPELIEGDRREFSVWVGEERVAERGWFTFPSEAKVVKAVRDALAS